MVDMDITRFWLAGPKSRSVNIFSASRSWMIFDVGFFYFEKMTFLDVFDMYWMFFDINSKYVVRFSQYLVKIKQYLNRAGPHIRILQTRCHWRIKRHKMMTTKVHTSSKCMSISFREVTFLPNLCPNMSNTHNETLTVGNKLVAKGL